MPCYRVCKYSTDYNGMKTLRALWEEWDLRILILYIFIAQLYLQFCGRRRRTNKSVLMMMGSVWLLYLFSDLLATIALGKLSKIKVDENDIDGDFKNGDIKKKMSAQSLRVMWAPLILFYLGGPDTITVLRVEENQLWVRHLIGLLTQGLRAAYALIVTWNAELGLSLVALLVFIPGIIKYAERVWVVRSRSNEYEDFLKLDLSTIDKMSQLRPSTSPVLQAYYSFQTLLPHNTSYMVEADKVKILVTRFRNSVRSDSFDPFKLIEIELGLMYDMFFSKIGTIFTVWGSILRFLSFSLIVSVLAVYLTCKKPKGYSEVDHIITIIVIAGAIFLEIAGIVVQLVSDWAIVWACQMGGKWTTLILFLHDILTSKSDRWSGLMGQFSLREFCKNYEPNDVFNKTWEWVLGREKMLKRFTVQKNPNKHLKETIIRHLRKKSENVAAEMVTDVDSSQTLTQKFANVDEVQISMEKDAKVDTMPKDANVDMLLISGVKKGEWTLERYNLGEQFKRSIEKLEFGQSIVIWHVATEVCYESERPKNFGAEEGKLKTAKLLSDYMMYLLVTCPSRFPFCDKYKEITKDYADMKKVLIENQGNTTSESTLVNKARKLVLALQEEKSKKWEIIVSMWVELLCYAAKKCPVKYHVQELRHGGEFLTHVWLLLMHFGITKKLERSPTLKDELDNTGIKGIFGGISNEIYDHQGGNSSLAGGIQATRKQLDENKVDGCITTPEPDLSIW